MSICLRKLPLPEIFYNNNDFELIDNLSDREEERPENQDDHERQEFNNLLQQHMLPCCDYVSSNRLNCHGVEDKIQAELEFNDDVKQNMWVKVDRFMPEP